MPRIYLDAVYNGVSVVFNDTPKNVKEWLKKQKNTNGMCVCVGRTLRFMTVESYLGGNIGSRAGQPYGRGPAPL